MRFRKRLIRPQKSLIMDQFCSRIWIQRITKPNQALDPLKYSQKLSFISLLV